MDKQRGLRTCLVDERGATAVEYGLIIALVVLALIAGLSTFASTTVGMWNDVANIVRSSETR